MRIVFMGTPEYSVETLKALIKAGHDVKAVFAQPDKPVGRKQILTAPPVKVFALKHNIPVFQPAKIKNNDEVLSVLKNIDADIIVVVAYGKILPKEILNMYKYGCINGHASLLPKYRGASPIQWAVVNGETQTGVTVMQMDEGMDTGDIIDTCKVEISDNDTADSMFDKLAPISAELTVKVLESIENNTADKHKQDEEKATYAPIIKKEMAHLDFNKNAHTVRCAVRGYYSWPCAFFFFKNKRIKVIECSEAGGIGIEAGELKAVNKELFVSCGDNTAVRLDIIQPEGSMPMKASDWLNGNSIENGERAE